MLLARTERQLETAVAQGLDLGDTGGGMRPGNSFGCDVAGELVQIKRNRPPLFARHLAVAFDLLFRGQDRGHHFR